MNVILDTCALLAIARGDLPAAAAAALGRAPEAHVSVVSAWEFALKVAGGKLRLEESPIDWFLGLIGRYQLRDVALDAPTASAAAVLPPIHRDPFDRAIVALAREHALTVLTSDDNIRKYPGVKTLW